MLRAVRKLHRELAVLDGSQLQYAKKFDLPTLVMHGDDDQIVPIKDSSKKSAKLIKGAKEIYYPGQAARSHGHAPG